MIEKLGPTLLIAASCVGCQGRPVPRDVTRVEGAIAAAPPVTPESLSPSARAAFDRDRIEVVPLRARAPAGMQPQRPASYKFQASNGAITENEFVRRYRALSGDRGLDDVEHWREPVFGWAAAFVGSAALATVFFAVLAHQGFDKGPEGGADVAGVIFAPILVIATGGFTVVAIIGRDGEEGGHELTEGNATTYARRYNQLLLLRAAGVTSAPLPPHAALFDPQVRSFITPVGVGVGGTF